MTHLTPDETRVLRITLGLHETQRSIPTQNHLPEHYAGIYAAAVAELVRRGLMHTRDKPATGWGGKVIPVGSYAATAAGITAIRDAPWK